jgi:putative two-component system response regulator
MQKVFIFPIITFLNPKLSHFLKKEPSIMQLASMNILIANDNEAQRTALREILVGQGYGNTVALADIKLVPHFLKNFTPDVMLLRLSADGVESLTVLMKLSMTIPSHCFLPIILLVDDSNAHLTAEGLAKGAKDFIESPYQALSVACRINSLLETRHYYLQLEQERGGSQKQAKEQMRQLERTQVEMITRLAHASEYRDDESGEHVWRIAHTSWLMAMELGLPPEQANLLLRAARLHDIGKIGIPDNILRKPGKLSLQEFEVVKTHTTIGAKLLSGGESPLIKMAELIALTHHERWDGTGYPRGLRGADIPIEGRILAITDTFDALIHDRIHQKALPLAEAVAEIKQQSGKQFDPKTVQAFESLYRRGFIPYQPTASSTFLPAVAF